MGFDRYSIRDATVGDLKRVAEIKVGNWADTYASLVPPAVLRPFLDQQAQLVELRQYLHRASTLFLVAKDETGAVVGFALTYVDRAPDPWLESLHVTRDSRGLGAGTRLLRETAARLQAGGYHTMRLGVVSGNTGAARFYERLGATMTGREPADWADGVWHEIYRWPDLSQLA